MVFPLSAGNGDWQEQPFTTEAEEVGICVNLRNLRIVLSDPEMVSADCADYADSEPRKGGSKIGDGNGEEEQPVLAKDAKRSKNVN